MARTNTTENASPSGSMTRLQDRFNVKRIDRSEHCFDIHVPEIYQDYERRWKFRSAEVARETTLRLSAISLVNHPEVFDECIAAIKYPCLPNMDFLMYAMMPHSQLRLLFTLMTGFNSWRLPLYPIECMLTFVPLDLIAAWLSLRVGGNRWRRGNDGTEFYVPNELDYEWILPKDIWAINRHTVHSGDGLTTSNVSLPEYVDRIFMGVGGLWSDVRLDPAGQGKGNVVQYHFNFRENGERRELQKFPPIESIAMNYMTALTHGTIMPFHYRKILEDLMYDRTGATGENRPR